MRFLNEILSLNKPSIYIKSYEDMIFDLIPELKVSKGFKQNNKWHIYDVYDHTLNVVDYVDASNINLRYAALFHDIGKPYVYSEDENGVGHFYGHWDKSLELFLKFAKRNLFSENDIEQISKLIKYHDINFEHLTEEELYEIINVFSREELILLFKLKRADLLSQSSEFHYLLEKYYDQSKRVLELKDNNGLY